MTLKERLRQLPEGRTLTIFGGAHLGNHSIPTDLLIQLGKAIKTEYDNGEPVEILSYSEVYKILNTEV